MEDVLGIAYLMQPMMIFRACQHKTGVVPSFPDAGRGSCGGRDRTPNGTVPVYPVISHVRC